MSSAVQDVKDLIDHLPDDASIEDIQYHLYVLEKIRRGQADIRDGKHFSSEEARERLSCVGWGEERTPTSGVPHNPPERIKIAISTD